MTKYNNRKKISYNNQKIITKYKFFYKMKYLNGYFIL